MNSDYRCASCVRQRKAICHSAPGNYCSDFILYPSTSTTTSKKKKSSRGVRTRGEKCCSDWALQGIHLPDIQISQVVEADGVVLTDQSHTPRTNFNTTNSYYQSPFASNNIATTGSSSYYASDYGGRTFGLESHNASIYDLVDISEIKTRPSRRPKDASATEKSTAWSSLVSSPITYPNPLERWESTSDRNESLAYRLEQPVKRRRH